MRIATIALLILASLGWAQEKSTSVNLSSLVPPDTMVLLEMDDLGGYERWTKDTALGRMWVEPEMQRFLGGMQKAIANAIETQRKQGRDPLAMVGLKMSDITGIVPRSGGIALIDLDPARNAYPDLLLTMEVRSGIDGVRRILDALRTAAGTFAGVGFQREAQGDIEIMWAELPMGGEVAYAIVGNRLLMASSRARVKDALVRVKGGRAANLHGSPAYQETLKTMGARRTGTLFLADVTRLRERVMGMLAPMLGNEMEEVGMIMEVTGMNAIERIAAADIPHDQNIRTEFLIQLSERKGIFGLMQSAPTSHRFAGMTPSNALVYSAERQDFGKTMDSLMEWVAKLDGETADEVNEFITGYNQVLGIDLRKDLVGSLGDEWAAYISDAPEGGLIPDVVMFVSVKDRAGLQKSLRALVEKYDAVNAMYGEDAVRRAPKIRHRKTMQGDRAIHCIEITTPDGEPIPVVPCWTMGEDHIALALWPHTLRNALRRKPTLADNPRFQSLRAGIPEGAITATYMDLPRLVGWTYNTAVPVLQGVQGAINRELAPFGASVNFHDLPSAGVLMRHLTPVLGYTKVEDTAIRFGYVSPFGMSLSAAAPAMVGVMVGMTFVLIEKGREVEVRAVAASEAEEEMADRARRKEIERYERRLAELERQLEELRRMMRESK